MIIGLGMDVIDVDRIESAMTDPKFVERILTPSEREIQPMAAARLAGRWAAKEAVAKAVSVELSWQDVEILNDEGGKPCAEIAAVKYNMEGKQLLISITHEKGHAAAVAILEQL